VVCCRSNQLLIGSLRHHKQSHLSLTACCSSVVLTNSLLAMPSRSRGYGFQTHNNNQYFILLLQLLRLFAALLLLDSSSSAAALPLSSRGGFTMAGRVAPFGKPPNEAAQVKSPLQGLPSVVSSRCACGSSRIDFRYYSAVSQQQHQQHDQHQQVTSNNNNDDIVDCHCSACRRFHVAAFVRYLRVPENDVSVTGDTVVRFPDTCSAAGDVLRTYCRKCSTKLLTTVVNRRPPADDNTVLVNMGPIDVKTIPENVAQQWVDTKPNMWSLNMEASWATAVPPETRPQWNFEPEPLEVSGGCTCGACKYEFELQQPLELQHCYCSLCRQLSGGPFMTWVPVDGSRQRFRWLREGSITKTNAGTPQRAFAPDRPATGSSQPATSEGEAPVVRYTDIGERHVCSKCGGVLSIVYDFDGEFSVIWLAAGGFDSIRFPFNVEPYLDRTVHICCNYKPEWYTLPDDGMPHIGEAS